MTKSLTFRCPDELLISIEEVGKNNYPAKTETGYDRSKTLVAILQVGLLALSEGTIHIPLAQTSQIVEQEKIKSVLREELLIELNELVKCQLQDVRQELDKRLTTLGERLA